MSQGSTAGLSRGDRRRNNKLGRLRGIVTRQTAVIAFDLAADKQVCAVTDPDSRVLARKTVTAKAWQLKQTVAWAVTQAARAGFTSVVVACEPTGHRWRVLHQTATGQGLPLVCVQPLLVGRARESEDFTRNKNDDSDAVVIARLVTELRCYLPEVATPDWARLRHLGARRAGQVTSAGAARQQVRDLLECAWPAALDAAAQPLDAKSWLAAMTVVCDLVGATGDLSVVVRLGWPAFADAVRAELPRHGTRRWYSPIVRAVYAAATDPALSEVGVPAQRPGALERVGFALGDLAHARAEIDAVETRMTALLDALGLTGLVTSIPGLTAVGAATILAETGDLTRYDSARAVVKHAGLCPRDNASGTYQGRSGISGRGRPGLRLAAWRAVFPALQHNPVLAARHRHLTTRADQPLTDTQARVAVAGSLLRQLHAVVTTATPWNASIASGGRLDDACQEVAAA